ncbi:hypothetical protein [Streptomyces rimosus]|uniref:hypothetical protein n=1 Tax=Streptomyces rimosus TaxID=1927 RepID=UPI0004C91C05|nr:hypothetical protein [Streptomyces rimosus]
MPEIKPDRSDKSRCISVHWNLPVQCVLPASHRENWHEAWHPQTGNRMRYRRSMGVYATEELHHGAWHDLEIPPPGGHCNDQHSHQPHVRCTQQYGHRFSWSHTATVDGCRYTWNTPPLKGLTPDQLDSDVKQLRGMAYELAAQSEQARRIAVELENENARLAARVRELERPAVEAERAEIRQSYTELIAQCEQDRDHEGAFDVQCRLREREEQWKREDESGGPDA